MARDEKDERSKTPENRHAEDRPNSQAKYDTHGQVQIQGLNESH